MAVVLIIVVFFVGYGVREFQSLGDTQKRSSELESTSEIASNENSANKTDNNDESLMSENRLLLILRKPEIVTNEELKRTLDDQLSPDSDRDKWKRMLERGNEDEILLFRAYSNDERAYDDPEKVKELQRLLEKSEQAELYLPEVSD